MDDERELIEEILSELNRARAKFPGDNVTTLALVEEVGETATALFEEPRAAVRKEAIQTAVMAIRLILDGDATLRLWRALKGLDTLIEGERLDGAASIAMERQRQISKEGWTAEHDDTYRSGELASAAACYLTWPFRETVPDTWPWEAAWWKPKNRRADLVRAGALIAAEIDRIDRLKTSADD